YAQVGSEGIIGMTVLKLKNPNPGAKHLETSDKHPASIPLHPGFLTSIKRSASKDMAKVSSILDRANQLLSTSNRQHLSRTIAQLDQATKKLVQMEKTIMPTLQKMPELSSEVKKTLKDSQQLIQQMQGLVSQAGETVDKASKVEESVHSLSESANRVT